MADKETQAGYKCQECETVWPEEDAPDFEPLYQCGSCGTAFIRSNSYDGNSHRCPDGMKFASKLYDMGCPDCEAGEVANITVTQDEDGEWVENTV